MGCLCHICGLEIGVSDVAVLGLVEGCCHLECWKTKFFADAKRFTKF